jgi:hypothetical protein
VKRGEEVPRPIPGWVLRCENRKAAVGWANLVRQARSNLDRAWLQLTTDPRHTSERQHQLQGLLAWQLFDGRTLDVWQYEVTAAGRIWYLVDDEMKTLWLVHAGPAHPKRTE